MKSDYVHGYDQRENIRLQDQALTLVDLLHSDTAFPAESKVLEAGCGVGAQTVTLAKKSPDAAITSIDISKTSLEKARQKITNVSFQQADIFDLPFAPHTFDHIFLCFVLEHLPNPVEALATLKNFIKPGGTITAIEGDHGSAYFYPDRKVAHTVIQCLVDLQKKAGGNSMIGRELYPVLVKAGYHSINVLPRMVYADASKPEMVEGFTRNTFTAMIEGVRESSLNAGLIDEKTFNQGIKALYRTAERDGVFCYTFFKAVAVCG